MARFVRFHRSLPAAAAVAISGIVLVSGLSVSAAHASTSGNPGIPAPVGSGAGNEYSLPDKTVPDVPNPGEYLFIQGCSTCHGLGGVGTQQAPSLIGVGAAAVDFYLSTGRMPLNEPVVQAPRKKPLYTAAQRAAIVQYVASLAPGPVIPNVNVSAGDLVEGNELYANNCAACHNSAGSGGALGRNYYAPRLDAATPQQVAEAIRVGPGAMPVFGNDTFTDQQVDSIVKYVGHLKEQHGPGGLSLGRLGPVSEGFFAWIVGLGVLMGFIYWIGTRV